MSGVLLGLGFILCVTAVVLILRGSRRRVLGSSASPTPAAPVCASRRPELLAQVRGRRPTQGQDVAGARRVAVELLMVPRTFLTLVGVALLQASSAVDHRSPLLYQVLVGTTLAAAAVAFAVAVLDARRARGYLAMHP